MTQLQAVCLPPGPAGVTSDVGSRPCPPPWHLSPERARGGGGRDKAGARGLGEGRSQKRRGARKRGRGLRDKGAQGEEESGPKTIVTTTSIIIIAQCKLLRAGQIMGFIC